MNIFFKIKVLTINILLFFVLTSNAISDENKKYNYEFKSIKSNDANMRIGPGKRFEIIWNFRKKGLPVKVLNKFEQWYKVETPDGSVGWMWSKLFYNKHKTVIFIENDHIYKKKSLESKVIANVFKNSILRVHFCESNWCKVEEKKHKIKGYVKTDNIWGAFISKAK
jgi:SH3-like domain-containing protein